MDFSREFGLASQVIEKDYVLGWLLAGISQHAVLGPEWVFKGGTCLKKCYFETYRFSEDLDFTIKSLDHLDEVYLKTAFQDIASWVYDTTGIQIPAETLRFQVYTNPRGKISVQGRIGYRGPMMRDGDLSRIKLDLTNDEVLVLDPVSREVHHPYSDGPEDGIHVQTYAFEEVFAEKVRALAERERPRDLYDVVHLYRHKDMRPDREVVLSTLEKKCAFKGIAVPTMVSLEHEPARAELEAEWANMLAHQLPALPPFNQFWEELPMVFEWLHGAAEKVAQPSMPLAAGEDIAWRPPVMAHAWHAAVPFEVIRFAAANRLCVDLRYDGSSRIIEPYSLRRTQDGNLLLHAVKHATGEPRSYRVDRIQGATVTQLAFVPRYVIELSETGPIHAPQTVRPARPSRSRNSSWGMSSNIGPQYIFECTVCGKKFTRKTYTAALNPHKDKNGYPCYGRVGMYVDTKY